MKRTNKYNAKQNYVCLECDNFSLVRVLTCSRCCGLVHRFPSKGEAARYFYLKGAEAVGEISNLSLQPRFIFPGKIGRWTGDFKYKKNGVEIIEDFKSGPTKTEAHNLRIRLMKFFQPGVTIIETNKNSGI